MLAPGAGPARDPRDVPRPRDRRQAPEHAGGLHGHGPRRDPRPGAHRGRGPRGRDRRQRRRGRRHRRGHHRRALGGPARPRGRRALPRGRGDHAGHPHGRGRPRHAVERDEHRGRPGTRRACVGEDLHAAAVRRTADPAYLPETEPERPRGRAASPRPRPPSRCAATSAGRGSSSVPTAGCVERTGKDLREVELLVGSGGVLRHASARGCAPGAGRRSPGSRRRGGSSPSTRGWWSTVTTCSRPSGCWRSAVPQPLRLWPVACRRATKPPTADQRPARPAPAPGMQPGRSGPRTRAVELRARLASQWAEVRAARRAAEATPEIVGGESNLRRAQVPYGMDLAAAWAWRFIVVSIAGLAILWLLNYFLVVVLPVVIALLIAALVSPVVTWLMRLGLRAEPGLADRGAGRHRRDRAAGDLRQQPDRVRGGRPVQAGDRRHRPDPRLAAHRSAARHRLPDQRRPRPGPGAGVAASARTRSARSPRSGRPWATWSPGCSSSCSRPTSSSPTATRSGPGWCGCSRVPAAPARTPRAAWPGARSPSSSAPRCWWPRPTRSG